jgi:uncharacterized paraquat-inducible protein A
LIKLVEISKAWIAASNPTDEQKKIAEKRLAICNKCEYSRHENHLDLYYCEKCICPLNKKIFSPKGPEACPEKKWTV